ncbi:leucine-rich repeat domain-containing protein [Aquimarina hainanensis]|uniref:Leucine-rich repeat domain-containing protein n=1 Tax=Aquimarina hainanensis TaxID=1578017 RepID=A0ABW5NA39_9FLAO
MTKFYIIFLFIIICLTSCGSNYKPRLVNGELDLSNKSLKKFPNIGNINKEEITIINLDNNSLKEFPEEILSFKNLKTINLSFNEIKKIPQSISDLKRLKNLNIRGNYISSLPKSLKLMENLRLVLLIDTDLSEKEIELMKCSLPAKCELFYSKSIRDYPPYTCNY